VSTVGGKVLKKALPASLHVKDRPGGDIAEKLMSYFWGLRVAKPFGQPCQLDQRVGKNHVTWDTQNEQERNYF